MNKKSIGQRWGMFFRLLIAAAILGLAGAAWSAPVTLGAVRRVSVGEGFAELDCERGVARVSMAGPGQLRLRAIRALPFSSFPSFAVLPGLRESAPAMKEEEGRYLFLAGELQLIVEKRSGRVDVLDREGDLLVGEPDGGGIFFDGATVGCVKASPADEHYYGFGEKTGPLDKRGTRMTMMNSDSMYGLNSDPLYQSHPFYLALRAGTAYGIFFDNTFRSEFDVAKTIGDQVKFMAAGGEVDYWVLAGPTPKDVLGNYSALIGRMPLPPLWGIGYHQCRYSYKTAQRVREIRDGFKENKIPVDAIYLDIHYMDDYRVFTFNSQTFPDPAGLVSELLADGIKTVVIVDPGIKIDPNYAVFNQCVSMKCYCTDPEGKPFVARVWPKEVYFPDFYRPETRTWWGDQHKFYTDLGIAGIWNDMNELAGWKRDIRLLGMSLGWGTVDWSRMRHGDEMVPHARIRNVYALLEAESTYDGLLRLRPEKRPFVISRAGYPGLQRYSLIWTGDNASTWGQLAMAVPMQLNLGLSGQPFVGADIGGFLGAPSPELFARWIEQGTFSPFCRNHTAVNMPNQEPWAFNDQVTAISRDAINLRYRLLPYTYSLFEEASRTGWPIMRAMPFEFPADERVTGIQDQYMWGEALMVAPVVAKGAIRRPVYFPAGDWYDWYSGKKFTGPAEIEVETPLARAPIFARGGAIVPLGPAIMHTNEKPLDPLTLVVFPGAAASSFSLYEDAGEGFGYREGDYARTELKSRPIAGGLEIQVGPRAGKFDPRRANVELKVYGLGPEVQVSMTSIEGQELPSPAATFDRAESAWLIRLGDEPAGRVIKMAAK